LAAPVRRARAASTFYRYAGRIDKGILRQDLNIITTDRARVYFAIYGFSDRNPTFLARLSQLENVLDPAIGGGCDQ
jgi:hypothetical protein